MSALAECQPKRGHRVSFEVFPPKNEAMKRRLWNCLDCLAPIAPDFVSVTCGAGGSATRMLVQTTVQQMVNDTSTPVAAHLTCIGATRDNITQIVQNYCDSGVRHIVALRGDQPAGSDQPCQPLANGFRDSIELIEHVRNFRRQAGERLEISVACYPEPHPESRNWQADIAFLKAKQDAGADRAITQFFFEPDTYLRFVERARAGGVTIPIVPGIMLQSNFNGLQRIAHLCQASLPGWLCDQYDGVGDDALARDRVTVQIATELCRKLADQGVEHFHFFTLNRATLALSVCDVLGFGSKTGQKSPHQDIQADEQGSV